MLHRKGKRGPPIARPLVVALKDFFDKPLCELPPELRDRVRRSFGMFWDGLSHDQRRLVASQLDQQHPQDLVGREAAEQSFRRGFKRIAFPRKQRLIAQRPRPSRQKVTRDQIQSAYDELVRQDLQPRAVDAYGLLFPTNAPLSLRAFQKRWRDFLIEIKKRT